MSAGKGDKCRITDYKRYYDNMNLLNSLPITEQKPSPASTCVEIKRCKNKVIYTYKNV